MNNGFAPVEKYTEKLDTMIAGFRDMYRLKPETRNAKERKHIPTRFRFLSHGTTSAQVRVALIHARREV